MIKIDNGIKDENKYIIDLNEVDPNQSRTYDSNS